MASETSSTAVARLQIEEIVNPRKRANGSAPHPPIPTSALVPPSPALIPEPVAAVPPPVATGPDPSVRVNRMILASLESVGFVLFPRLLLLMSLGGAFVLGVMAMRYQTQIVLEILIAFTTLTVAPLAWLERMSRRS